MGQIYEAHEEIGDAQEQEVPVVLDMPRIPGDDEYGKGNDYAEEFSKGMEYEKIVQGGKIEQRQEQGEGEKIQC